MLDFPRNYWIVGIGSGPRETRPGKGCCNLRPSPSGPVRSLPPLLVGVAAMTAENHRALVLLSALAFLWNLSSRIEPPHPAAPLTPEARWVTGLLGTGKSSPRNSFPPKSGQPHRDMQPRSAPTATDKAVMPDLRVVSLGKDRLPPGGLSAPNRRLLRDNSRRRVTRRRRTPRPKSPQGEQRPSYPGRGPAGAASCPATACRPERFGRAPPWGTTAIREPAG